MLYNIIYPYFLFYRSNFAGSFIISLVCAYTIFAYGGTAIAPAFWLKVFVYGITIWYVNTFNVKAWYFYKNMGITKNRLWTVLTGLDFMIFIILTILVYK